jgi:ACS family hexuronate transporter-like MFS transporter
MNWLIGRITEGGSYTLVFIVITLSVVLAVLSILFLIKKVRLVVNSED